MNLESVKIVIHSGLASYNSMDIDGRSALMYAVINLKIDIVGLLISNRDIDLTLADKNGKLHSCKLLKLDR